MHQPDLHHHSYKRLLVLFIFLAFVLTCFSSIHAQADSQNSWHEVEQLLKEQKITSANKIVRIILEQAQQDKHMENWTRALITRADNQLHQGEIETALREFTQQPWPEEPYAQLVLNLYYANTLTHYINRYQWEINQRETLASKTHPDFTKMTMPQLVHKTHQTYQTAHQLANNDKLPTMAATQTSLGQLTYYFKLGDYPETVRGTLKDTVTYLWLDFLSQQHLWSAKHSNQTDALSVQQLLAPQPQSIDLRSEAFHPAVRMAALLEHLEQSHRAAQRPEAALEAWHMRIQHIARLKNSKPDHALLIPALQTRLIKTDSSLAWINHVRLTLAELINNTKTADSSIKALAVLETCIASTTSKAISSIINEQCQQAIKRIKQPNMHMQSMLSDGLQKRSIQIEHKNIDTLHFRAWRLAAKEVLTLDRRTEQKFAQTMLAKPAEVTWTETLPPNQDYKKHISYITPPLKQHGVWVIAASITPDFQQKKHNSLTVTTLTISNLVAQTRINKKTLDITVYQGETGQLLPNTTVELWSLKDRKKIALSQTSQTNTQGHTQFTLNQDHSYQLFVEHNNDSLLSPILYAGHRRTNKQKIVSSLIFTDRAIYRPSQKIQWKVVAYQGNSNKDHYQTLPDSKGFVELLDSNNKVVEKKTISTNSFGSASGTFTAVAGKMLGNWSIRTSWQGYQSIRVEEYKRPTFSVAFNNPASPLRLNQPATLTGKANYYFGQAVSEGKVAWRVQRKPRYRWYEYGFNNRSSSEAAETIATGTTTLDNAGEFTVSFLPSAAKTTNTANNHSVSYTFEMIADITDTGGETRSSQRSYRLGHTAIEAVINHEQQYSNSDTPYSVTIDRTDLDGIGRAGKATWSLHTIQQPATPILPADKPLALSKQQQTYATKGDTLRPRWASDDFDHNTLFKQWQQGNVLKQDAIQHDATGKAQLNLGKLAAGLYRLNYQTQDAWGKTFSTQKTIIISNQQHTPLQTPLFLQAQSTQAEVGNTLQLLAGSGFKQLPVTLEIYQQDKLLQRTILRDGIQAIPFSITEKHRGGLTVILSATKDYQVLRKQQHIDVPWSNRKLKLAFTTFRDKLRPGEKEKWRITVKDSKDQALPKEAVEVLAAMYDRSLDIFAPFTLQDTQGLYPKYSSYFNYYDSIGRHHGLLNWQQHPYPSAKRYQATQLISRYNNYGTRSRGGNQSGGILSMFASASAPPMATRSAPAPMAEAAADSTPKSAPTTPTKEAESTTMQVRSNFNETAFFYPHLRLEDDGSVSFEFDVPESVTEWKAWVSALTTDLRSGVLTQLTQTSKTLMVRPYLPRFLREGDQAEIEVMVNNTGEQALTGQLQFELYDPKTEQNLASAFKLNQPQRTFSVAAGESTSLRFKVKTPNKAGLIAIRTTASAGEFNDGEQHALAILPSRIHLSQSRFTTLVNGKADSKTLTFEQLATPNDPTRINDKLVVTVDGQLFYSVLNALPYLVDYPYQCTEQTLNRFLSTSIIKSVFDQHPAIANMAKQMSTRDSQLASWNKADPNRSMLLEETPWLNQAAGGTKSEQLLRILDPTIAQSQQQNALQKLQKAQTDSGGFPWWEGGRASPYMTAYLLHGFAKALEFKVDIPQNMVQRSWKYLHKHYQEIHKKTLAQQDDLHLSTFISYLLSAYPDKRWTANVFSEKDRQTLLNTSFEQWTKLSPLLKSYLALSLHRAGRTTDASLVFDSIMDLAKTDEKSGTYFAPEARSWLWYNDSVDSHAFILRTLNEINPQDPRRHGLVQWLMLNKKLNHWKSTRATAESIYALTHYLQQEGQLGTEERAQISIGNTLKQQLAFKPEAYTGDNNQLVVAGEEITPEMATITVAKETKNLMFASASWHFSTEKAPTSAQGDFFHVKRAFFKRVQKDKQWVLQPLTEGATLAVGDQLEVQLSLQATQNAEYIHLRSPRGAGFEPVSQTSGYHWQLGVGYYEEIRDSGANYFFEHLPTGNYQFKYRLRATTAGVFKVAPTTIQSMYAPEFNAYSTGESISIQ